MKMLDLMIQNCISFKIIWGFFHKFFSNVLCYMYVLSIKTNFFDNYFKIIFFWEKKLTWHCTLITVFKTRKHSGTPNPLDILSYFSQYWNQYFKLEILSNTFEGNKILPPWNFINLSFWTIYKLAIPTPGYQHQVTPMTSLSMPGHDWAHLVTPKPTASFLHNYLYAKNLRYWLFSSRDIDDQETLKSYWTRVHLVYILRLPVLNCKKKYF